MSPQKIAVIGISGSGKSFFARKLAEKTQLPIFHMDTLFWKGKWNAVPEVEYVEKQNEILAQNEKWIIEGYVDRALADRLKAADLIIYLDYSGFLYMWRVLRRWLKHRRQSRSELPKEAVERLSGKFLWTVLTRAEKPGIEEALAKADSSKVIRFSSSRLAHKFRI